MLIFSLRRWLGNPGWPVVLVLLLSIGAGVLAAQGSYAHHQPIGTPDTFPIVMLAINFPQFAASVGRFWTARGVMGPRLYAFSRPGNRQLTWSGRTIMLMSVLSILLLLRPA